MSNKILRKNEDLEKRPFRPSTIRIFYTNCANWPTKIVGIHRKIRNCFIYYPVFRKTITPTNFLRIPISISTIITFYKGSINLLTYNRIRQSIHHRDHRRYFPTSHLLNLSISLLLPHFYPRGFIYRQNERYSLI